jgi:predicted dehydrogenase
VSKVKPVRILFLGTGSMANSHAEAFAAIPGVELVAGVDTIPASLEAFAAKHGLKKTFATLDEAIAWGGFDAVTNVTPDPAHHPTTMKLLAAGKHVLCEKPLATDRRLAREMAEAAKARGVVNLVNLTYRNVPALQQAARVVKSGALGRLMHLEASYLQSWLAQPAWGDWKTEPRWLWRLSSAHGSKGCLGDIGIHVLDFATFVAGEGVAEVSCKLKTFDKAPGGRIGEYVLDANDAFVIHLGLTGGAVGTVSATRFAPGHLNDLRLRLYGEDGGLEVLWEKNVSSLRTCLGEDAETATWTEVACPEVTTNYQRFVAAIRGEAVEAPDFARGADLQHWLDLAGESDAAGGRMLSA